ncbi:ubiquitin-associated- domain-containing protein [Pyrolobus fumarii 1A]|uniref:Nascent polypeptide-associated complex protein n=1 Tax=Pyrolobus fumarii (strain DSM 11204 / 1A) TaxID=694429 RepID=G0EHD4_PYRF1|nr:nascent polypeptide-associated complex protein [Pyrolobus fumarii]AEM38509.1 ubiquitin-associated- domain-containing protein [Pyrolobus fumarii 1A]
MRFAVSPRELSKILRRMGVSVEANEVKASRVVIETEDGKRMVMEPEHVMILKIQGQYYMVEIIAPSIEEEKIEEVGEAEKPSLEIREEDVRLVAEQAGVSLEEARKALEETGGDIAAAILKLMERKG